MKVVEIFDSIQGEGYWMGTMCTFIRLAGCNLACPFCDERSKYERAKEMSEEEIAAQVNYDHVVVTGGEPTLQPLGKLMTCLHQRGCYVHLETNGTKGIINWGDHNPDWITCSPKAPDYAVNCKTNEIKLVVSDDLTIEQALSFTRPGRRLIWLQPCDGPGIEESRQKIMDWVRLYPTVFRAGIQLHKWYGVV